MRVLVTGAAGYVGAHVVDLLSQETDMEVYGMDVRESRVKGSNHFTQDIRLVPHFSTYDVVVHLAAYIFPRESMSAPLEYYDNNVSGTISALALLKDGGHFVLGSTGSAQDPVSPYSKSKVIAEQVVADTCALTGSTHTSFRFFNVAGSDGYARIHQGKHLISAAIRSLRTGDPLVINGGDYPTRDGTCLRDYTHPGDIAEAVLSSIRQPGLETLGNLAVARTGPVWGYTNLEVVATLERVAGEPVPYVVGPAVPGDAPAFTFSTLSKHNVSSYSLEDMIRQELESYV